MANSTADKDLTVNSRKNAYDYNQYVQVRQKTGIFPCFQALLSVFVNYLQHFDDKNCVGYNFVH